MTKSPGSWQSISSTRTTFQFYSSGAASQRSRLREKITSGPISPGPATGGIRKRWDVTAACQFLLQKIWHQALGAADRCAYSANRFTGHTTAWTSSSAGPAKANYFQTVFAMSISFALPRCLARAQTSGRDSGPTIVIFLTPITAEMAGAPQCCAGRAAHVQENTRGQTLSSATRISDYCTRFPWRGLDVDIVPTPCWSWPVCRGAGRPRAAIRNSPA